MEAVATIDHQVRFWDTFCERMTVYRTMKRMLHVAEKEYLPGGIRERMEDLRDRRKHTLKEVPEKTGIDCSTLSGKA